MFVHVHFFRIFQPQLFSIPEKKENLNSFGNQCVSYSCYKCFICVDFLIWISFRNVFLSNQNETDYGNIRLTNTSHTYIYSYQNLWPSALYAIIFATFCNHLHIFEKFDPKWSPRYIVPALYGERAPSCFLYLYP